METGDNQERGRVQAQMTLVDEGCRDAERAAEARVSAEVVGEQLLFVADAGLWCVERTN